MSDAIPICNTPPTGNEEEDAYNRAADIAHNMTAGIPAAVRAAGAEPIDAAYALWNTYTRILLQNGWTACDLAETAHELQAEQDEEVDGGADGAVH